MLDDLGIPSAGMTGVIDRLPVCIEARAMFYGWRIVSAVFLTNFISIGLVFYSYGVFFKALAADFGGSRLGVATGLAIMNIATAAISPYLGRLVDRGSIRNIMCGGACLMAAGFFLAARIEALWQLYVLMGTLLAVGSAMLGALAGSTLIANWFSERRGTALGISGVGISLSGLAMAPVATLLIGTIGWRGTFVVYGIATLATVVPAVWFVVVNRPEDLGLLPDGQNRALHKLKEVGVCGGDDDGFHLPNSRFLG